MPVIRRPFGGLDRADLGRAQIDRAFELRSRFRRPHKLIKNGPAHCPACLSGLRMVSSNCFESSAAAMVDVMTG
jgi:hypothetical protein